jgi:hypothetical protein
MPLEFTSEPQAGDEEDKITLPAITFGLDGEKFSTVTSMNGATFIEWSELGIAASEDIDAESPEGAAYVARFLRAALGPAEYGRFRRHVRSHKTGVSVVLKVVAGIQEEMTDAVLEHTGRPTEPSSPSSDGDGVPDERVHKVISLQRGDVTFAPPPPARQAQAQVKKVGHGKSRAG